MGGGGLYSGVLALVFCNMKKILIVLVFGFFTLCSFSTAASLVDDAVARAYAKNLTMYYDTKAFNPNNHIRRDDAAKFFVNFAKLVGKTEYVVNANQCQFPDLNEAWSDLRGFVVESCRL